MTKKEKPTIGTIVDVIHDLDGAMSRSEDAASRTWSVFVADDYGTSVRAESVTIENHEQLGPRLVLRLRPVFRIEGHELAPSRMPAIAGGGR